MEGRWGCWCGGSLHPSLHSVNLCWRLQGWEAAQSILAAARSWLHQAPPPAPVPGPASLPGSQPNPALHFFTQSHSSTSYTHHCNFEHDAATGDWFSRKSAFIPETFSASLIYVSFYHRNFLSLVGGWVDVGGWSASQSAPAAGRY